MQLEEFVAVDGNQLQKAQDTAARERYWWNCAGFGSRWPHRTSPGSLVLEQKCGTLLKYGVEVFGNQFAALVDLTELLADSFSIFALLTSQEPCIRRGEDGMKPGSVPMSGLTRFPVEYWS